MAHAIDAAALHNAGGDAYVMGADYMADCPYPLASWSHRYWSEGFMEARTYYPPHSAELANLQRLYQKAA